MNGYSLRRDWRFFASSLQTVAHACAGLALLLDVLLGALLHFLDRDLAGPVRLDSLLAVRGELRLPVALAFLLLLQQVHLVLVHLVRVRVVWGRARRESVE